MKKVIKSINIDTRNVNIENVCLYQNELKNLLILNRMEDSEYIQEAIADTEKKISRIMLTKKDLEFSHSHTVEPYGKDAIIVNKK